MNENCEQCKTNTGSPYAFYHGVTITSNVEGPVSVSLCQECVKKLYKRDLWGGLVAYLITAGIFLPLGYFLLFSNGPRIAPLLTGAGILQLLGGFIELCGWYGLALFLITLARAPWYAFFLNDAGRERWRRKAEAGEKLAISVSRKRMKELHTKRTWTPKQREKALRAALKRKR